MHRQSLWLIAIVLLVGTIMMRDPRFARSDDSFLRWLLQNTTPAGQVPLAVVEIGTDQIGGEPEAANGAAARGLMRGTASAVSPLEFALFLQSVLDFKPPLLAFESILRWREKDKDQEQVFLDQAMRAPRLLLATELTATPEPDATAPEYAIFTQVAGKRGALAEFSGVARQPSEDLRLISTPGFVNLPDEVSDDIHVPLLFQYRGEVVPSFPLQALMIWLRVNPSEVKIQLGSYIELPRGRRIPIAPDGALLINPNAAKRAKRYSLNEFLYAVQQQDKALEQIRNGIVLTRTPLNPLAPPDVYAATIATLQSDTYVRRVNRAFDIVLLLLIAAAAFFTPRMPRFDLVLIAIALSAAYCLAALTLISRFGFWLPGVLPLTLLWLLVVISMLASRTGRAARGEELIASPPTP